LSFKKLFILWKNFPFNELIKRDFSNSESTVIDSRLLNLSKRKQIKKLLLIYILFHIYVYLAWYTDRKNEDLFLFTSDGKSKYNFWWIKNLQYRLQNNYQPCRQIGCTPYTFPISTISPLFSKCIYPRSGVLFYRPCCGNPINHSDTIDGMSQITSSSSAKKKKPSVVTTKPQLMSLSRKKAASDQEDSRAVTLRAFCCGIWSLPPHLFVPQTIGRSGGACFALSLALGSIPAWAAVI
jgi:hypothetical protein